MTPIKLDYVKMLFAKIEILIITSSGVFQPIVPYQPIHFTMISQSFVITCLYDLVLYLCKQLFCTLIMLFYSHFV